MRSESFAWGCLMKISVRTPRSSREDQPRLQGALEQGGEQSRIFKSFPLITLNNEKEVGPFSRCNAKRCGEPLTLVLTLARQGTSLPNFALDALPSNLVQPYAIDAGTRVL